MALPPFAKALEQARSECDHVVLLMGNGFSIACDPTFDYRTLYDRARLAPRPRQVFDALGTADFELVVDHLEGAGRFADVYGAPKLGARLRADADRVRHALADAIADVHPSRLPDAGLERCCRFLEQFDELFTLNYDVLVYWATQRNRAFRDGFTRLGGRLVHGGGPRQNVSWVHGGLHLYEEERAEEVEPVTYKRERKDGAIVDQVRADLDGGGFPLIVMEGDAVGKRRKIDRSPYLRDALDRLRRTRGALFTFGWGFGANDQHVLEALAESEITRLFVGLVGDRSDGDNPRICGRAAELTNAIGRRRVKRSYYDAGSARIWP